jgi:pyruvate dehydrogenase E1 component alpha subunit
MPQKVLKKFKVEYLQILKENGTCDEHLKPKNLGKKAVLKIYKLMVLSRMFDEKMFKLQRQGKLYTFAQSKGQEAADIGSTLAIGKNDWVVPYFRNWPSYITLGYPLHMLLQYNSGDERGMAIPKNVNAFPVCVPVGTQVPHGVGFAWGMKLQRKKGVVIVYLGDGATSEGSVHEGMNFAGVFGAPVVFVCENNQYAISVPRSRQSAAKTLAQKAIAYGIHGIQVDGNDVFAIYRATKEAVARAKKGKPTFIEAFTYRLADHTTSDSATKYRSEKEVAAWRKKDPITRLFKYIEKKKWWNKKKQGKLYKEITAQINAAVIQFEKLKPPAAADMFDYMYAKKTDALVKQQGEVALVVKRVSKKKSQMKKITISSSLKNVSASKKKVAKKKTKKSAPKICKPGELCQ